MPPCAVKTCAVRPVFARVVGYLRAADPSNVQGPVNQNASPGEQSEAPRPRWKRSRTQDQKTRTQGKKKHKNINKFAGLSRDWVGGKNVLCVFFRVIPHGERKRINKIPPKSRDNYAKNLFTCFFYVFFCSLRTVSTCWSNPGGISLKVWWVLQAWVLTLLLLALQEARRTPGAVLQFIPATVNEQVDSRSNQTSASQLPAPPLKNITYH